MWFCEGCSTDSQNVNDKTDDRVITLLEKMLDRLNIIEGRLTEKADVNKVEELERRVMSLEISMKEQCEVGEPRVDQTNGRGHMEDSGPVTVNSLEVRETEMR